MPGVITMDASGPNGTRTDHDRDTSLNGVNGASIAGSEHSGPAKDKAVTATTTGDEGTNAVNGQDASRRNESKTDESSEEKSHRMNDLPDEIVHITQGFVPLSLLLTRLAQTTHNALQDKIAELAKMPLPAAAVNGNSSYSSSAPDDSSADNLRKKGNLMNFAQEWHGKWLKALVIAEWSRKSPLVSKLIDLKFHIDQQRIFYDASLDNIVNVKRDLTFARMPSPDLKTALQVLSTGNAPWMPELQYIEPPALTSEDQLKWMNDLNTLLSIRLNLEDFDKIPQQFRNYDIDSGRVTFKVDGEFEVDLTIADEDFEKQFWFIDFRYAFVPAASSLPESLRAYLEGCVNDVLGKEGLAGCYQFLHEFVLTSKINELKRQALQLSRSSWTGTLNVESLNRSFAIQYWTSRSSTTGAKSWILIAINSNRKPNSQENATSTSSQLVAKWYRDNKEVKDAEIELNVHQLSAESLLTNVIARHIEFILTSIYDKLSTASRFKNREAAMVLRTSRTDPAVSVVTAQVGYNEQASVLIEPMTGVFAVKPLSKFTIQAEHQLNSGKNPAEDGVNCLEHIRCAMMEDDLRRRGSSMGWFMRKSPMTTEELKLITKMRDWGRAIWLQKDGWGSSWFLVVVLSLSGDEWWLLESGRKETNKARFHTKLPLNNDYPNLSDAFWNNLAFFTTGIIAQSVDLRELHRHEIKSKPRERLNLSLPQQVQLPSIDVALSALFPVMVPNKDADMDKTGSPAALSTDGPADSREVLSLMQRASGAAQIPKKPWADNVVSISFKGIRSLSKSETANDDGTLDNELICVSEAVIKVRKPSKFASFKGLADRDVSYHPQRGEFSLRIQRALGKPILDSLKSRIKAIDRFVNFLEAMDTARGGTITTESVTLRQITFHYCEGKPVAPPPSEAPEEKPEEPQKRWRVILDLSKDEIDIAIEKGNPHLRVLDLMRRLVNSDGGISALMAWLPASLPALMAIDRMETDWEALEASGKGRLEFCMKSIAWMSIAYTLNFGDDAKKKQVSLEIKMKPRRGEAWWHVWRSDEASNTDDAVSKVLQPVWDGRGDNWHGLNTGAAGLPHDGVVALLLAVDEAIKRTVTNDGSAAGNAVVLD